VEKQFNQKEFFKKVGLSNTVGKSYDFPINNNFVNDLIYKVTEHCFNYIRDAIEENHDNIFLKEVSRNEAVIGGIKKTIRRHIFMDCSSFLYYHASLHSADWGFYMDKMEKEIDVRLNFLKNNLKEYISGMTKPIPEEEKEAIKNMLILKFDVNEKH